MGFGGNNGFTDFKDIAGFDLPERDTTRAIVLLVATVVALAIHSYWGFADRSSASRAGRVIRAIRDAENRTRISGLSRGVVKLLSSSCRPSLRASPVRCTSRRSVSSIRRNRADKSIEAVLGRGRRPRYVHRSHPRGGAGQLRENLFHGCAPGSLALRPRRHVRGASRCSFQRGMLPGPPTPEQVGEDRPGALPRKADGDLRRLQGTRLVVDLRRIPANGSVGDRPQRRRQDDDDGRHYRQDEAGQRIRMVRESR